MFYFLACHTSAILPIRADRTSSSSILNLTRSNSPPILLLQVANSRLSEQASHIGCLVTSPTLSCAIVVHPSIHVGDVNARSWRLNCRAYVSSLNGVRFTLYDLMALTGQIGLRRGIGDTHVTVLDRIGSIGAITSAPAVYWPLA